MTRCIFSCYRMRNDSVQRWKPWMKVHMEGRVWESLPLVAQALQEDGAMRFLTPSDVFYSAGAAVFSFLRSHLISDFHHIQSFIYPCHHVTELVFFPFHSRVADFGKEKGRWRWKEVGWFGVWVFCWRFVCFFFLFSSSPFSWNQSLEF